MMKEKGKKIIYVFLYGLVILAFAYLGTRDYNKDEVKTDNIHFHEDYPTIKEDNKFKYLNTTQLIEFLDNGSGILFLGDKENEWSIKYAETLYSISKDIKPDKIYYYDVKKVKSLKNSNYYAIIKSLEGYLVETDDNKNNLFTPSLYILKDGKVVFHDATTAVNNNEIKIDEFWTNDKLEDFMINIKNAIEEYC